jgi:alpha-galactosidase
MNILDLQAGLESFSGPGHWNDPDMLEVGNGGMTADEYRAHFSLWAMLAAPLIAGNDLTRMTPETRAILTNAEVIAVDQDPLGVQARRVVKDGDAEVWSRPLADGGRAVVLLNRSSQARRIAVRWADLGYPAGLKLRVRDLWRGKDLPRAAGGFEAETPPHGVVMVRLAG